MKDVFLAGGPAFPSHGTMGEVAHEGMTLRDYFAIHAPEPSVENIGTQMGLDRGRNPHNDHHKPPLRSKEEIKSFLRYQYSDAMLSERAKASS